MLFSEYKNESIKKDLNNSQMELLKILESKNVVLHNITSFKKMNKKTIFFLSFNLSILFLSIILLFFKNSFFTYFLTILLLFFSINNIIIDRKKIIIPIYFYIVSNMRVSLDVLEAIKSSSNIENRYLSKISENKNININYKKLYKIFNL